MCFHQNALKMLAKLVNKNKKSLEKGENLFN